MGKCVSPLCVYETTWLLGLERRDLPIVFLITSLLWEFRGRQPEFLPEVVITVENFGFESYMMKVDKMLDIIPTPLKKVGQLKFSELVVETDS